VLIAMLDTGSSRRVRIFVQFKDKSSAQDAVKMLHRRCFGGKIVDAQIYDENSFEEEDHVA